MTDEFLKLLDEMIAKHERLALQSKPLEHPSACHNTIAFICGEIKQLALAEQERILKELEQSMFVTDEQGLKNVVRLTDAFKIVKGMRMI